MPQANPCDVLRSSPRPSWEVEWRDILRKRCAQRLLIVTDVSGSFDAGSPWGLTELIRMLEDTGDLSMPVPVTVTTASTADGFSFAGATPPVTVTHYDQIWLFGFTPGAAGPSGADLHVLVSFMQAGGGLFATGERGHIGQALSGALPRVRKMRSAVATPPNRPVRANTLSPDGVPLEAPCQAPRGAALEERMTAIGSPGRATLAEFHEFPSVNGYRIGPEWLALALPARRAVMSAYDGHPAGVGRVVCDATWHPFVNMNLHAADGTTPHDCVNLAEYLAPQNRRWCWLFDRLFTELYRCPLWADLQTLPLPPWLPEQTEPWPPPHPLPWPLLMQAGELLAAALQTSQGPGAADRLVRDLVDVADLPPELAGWAESLHPRLQRHGVAELAKSKTLHVHDDPSDRRGLQLGAIGSLLLRLRSALPSDPQRALRQAELLHDKGFKVFRALWLQDLAAGAEHLAQQHSQALRSIKRLGRLG